jgi:hypothetical protein
VVLQLGKVYNNDDIALKLTKDEKNASMVYRLLDCNLRTAWLMMVVSRFVESECQVLEEQLTRPEEGFGKGEKKEWKVTRKYVYQFDIEDSVQQNWK